MQGPLRTTHHGCVIVDTVVNVTASCVPVVDDVTEVDVAVVDVIVVVTVVVTARAVDVDGTVVVAVDDSVFDATVVDISVDADSLSSSGSGSDSGSELRFAVRRSGPKSARALPG
jgi:hypothetical protein